MIQEQSGQRTVQKLSITLKLRVMDEFKQELERLGFEGEIDDSIEARDDRSHDASLFELMPQLVLFPRDAQDVERIVRTAQKFKSKMPDLSLTARSAGTDMSGGAINDSVIIDFTRHMNRLYKAPPAYAQEQPR